MESTTRPEDPSAELVRLVARYLDGRIGRTELTAWLADHIDWVISGPRATPTALPN